VRRLSANPGVPNNEVLSHAPPATHHALDLAPDRSASLLPAFNQTRVSIADQFENPAADRGSKEQQAGSEGGNPIQ
jgi:hypothetical protein